jgi:predicted nucleic acid-binding protein
MGMPAMKIALDTNVLIYFLEGIDPQASKVERVLNTFMKTENEGLISTISVAEILTGFYMAGEQKKAVKAKKLLTDLALDSFKIIPVTFEIADLAASLRAKRGGRLPDALIIGTAIKQGADVLYTEDKDLQRFNKDVRICSLLEK